ncbi:hypothetical protein GHT06_020497 [Daphnia sinensis]|uniref:Uncharacterized protein n=1 Tax=Daphnia sinensis TaxID=1820382 RepID=A0AAD5PP65_9CRUS|nr:hypothetical protein GHT06_020497 [Daphnia sinensis]
MLLSATTPKHRNTTQLQVTIRLKPPNTTPQKRQSTTLTLTPLLATTPRPQLIIQQPMPLPDITLRHQSTISQGGLNNQTR